MAVFWLVEVNIGSCGLVCNVFVFRGSFSLPIGVNGLLIWQFWLTWCFRGRIFWVAVMRVVAVTLDWRPTVTYRPAQLPLMLFDSDQEIEQACRAVEALAEQAERDRLRAEAAQGRLFPTTDDHPDPQT